MDNPKLFLKKLLPPILLDLASYFRTIIRNASFSNPDFIPIPWSVGYTLYRQKQIEKAISDETVMDTFRNSMQLPMLYGVGIDERCIEYPMLIANISQNAQNLLDAGSILNHEYILKHPLFNNKKIHIITLSPEKNCYWEKGISYLYGDLRDIPIRDNYYDEVICISVLEHIGCDNQMFANKGKYNDDSPMDFIAAIKEMSRVLKHGGSLLLTVPFGKYRHFGIFQQFDYERLSLAIEAFGTAARIVQTFYKYKNNGWQLSNADECAECEYVGWLADAWRNSTWPDVIPKEPDNATAARAVACVRITK